MAYPDAATDGSDTRKLSRVKARENYPPTVQSERALPGPTLPVSKKTGIKCQLKHWTTERFSTKHVDALLGAFAREVPPGSQVTLFGHSGGGVMALQLAGRLGDKVAIRKIVITGTPVDVSEWTRANGFSDLTVENYLDSLRALAARTVPVFALFGDLDSVVPEKYMGIAAEAGLSIQTRVLTNTSHGQLAGSESTLEILLDPSDQLVIPI